MNIVSHTKYHPALSPIEEVIEDARNGRMFILVDAEERENEGDLVIPAQMATPDAINFMTKHGRGLVCLSLNADRAKQLHLELMSRSNRARHSTAFTVSIEAREGVSTGISAHDRAHTISVAIDPTKDFRDIMTPGHVFPLVAKDGGVLVRAGHTEAAVDIARLAGLYPAGVICEIMNDDGTMARLPDLIAFAQLTGSRSPPSPISSPTGFATIIWSRSLPRPRSTASMAAPSRSKSMRRRSTPPSMWR